MNKLLTITIIVLLTFGIVIGGTITLAKKIVDSKIIDCKKDKDCATGYMCNTDHQCEIVYDITTSCLTSKDVTKCNSKQSKILADYNKDLKQNLTSDKIVTKKEKKMKDIDPKNPIEITEVEINGQVITVISAH